MELAPVTAILASPSGDTPVDTIAQAIAPGPPQQAMTEARGRYEDENRVKTRVRKWLQEGRFQWKDDTEFRATYNALTASTATVKGERFSATLVKRLVADRGSDATASFLRELGVPSEAAAQLAACEPGVKRQHGNTMQMRHTPLHRADPPVDREAKRTKLECELGAAQASASGTVRSSRYAHASCTHGLLR